jgi:hypothetical protein
VQTQAICGAYFQPVFKMQEDDFGRVRLWGAVGWGGISPLAGLLIDHAGVDAAFIAYGAIAMLCLLPVLAMDFSRVRGSGRGGSMGLTDTTMEDAVHNTASNPRYVMHSPCTNL